MLVKDFKDIMNSLDDELEIRVRQENPVERAGIQGYYIEDGKLIIIAEYKDDLINVYSKDYKLALLDTKEHFGSKHIRVEENPKDNDGVKVYGRIAVYSDGKFNKESILKYIEDTKKLTDSSCRIFKLQQR